MKPSSNHCSFQVTCLQITGTTFGCGTSGETPTLNDTLSIPSKINFFGTSSMCDFCSLNLYTQKKNHGRKIPCEGLRPLEKYRTKTMDEERIKFHSRIFNVEHTDE